MVPAKNAAPTGPIPRPTKATQPTTSPGHTVVSHARWHTSANPAVTRQKPETASVGTLPKRRFSSEYVVQIKALPSAAM